MAGWLDGWVAGWVLAGRSVFGVWREPRRARMSSYRYIFSKRWIFRQRMFNYMRATKYKTNTKLLERQSEDRRVCCVWAGVMQKKQQNTTNKPIDSKQEAIHDLMHRNRVYGNHEKTQNNSTPILQMNSLNKGVQLELFWVTLHNGFALPHLGSLR